MAMAPFVGLPASLLRHWIWPPPGVTSYPCHMMCRQVHITQHENIPHLDLVDTRAVALVS
jgi:hypothetical protein